MKKESFKEQVQNLEYDKLFELLSNIIIREEYEVIEKGNFYLITLIKQGIQPTRSAFLLYDKSLSGSDVDLNSIQSKISELETKEIEFITIVSINTVSQSVGSKLKNSANVALKFIERDEFEKLVEKHYPNYLFYESFNLIEYERYFLEEMTEKSPLLNINGLQDRVKRLMEIYVNPQLYELKKDIESDFIKLVRVSADILVKRKTSAIVEGDTGSGKSTLLKEIGRQIIKLQDSKKTLPIYLSPTVIRKYSFDIMSACENLLSDRVQGSWEEIQQNYNLTLLIDGIDEFNNLNQDRIIKQLNTLSTSKVRYILTTRSIEANNLGFISSKADLFKIRKFNNRQIKEFANRFFNSQNLSNNLIEALTDNRILERIPITPLSMSLISLVYEKENFEIPATISDIYDNFNQLILGKATANKQFELIKFNFRERILSIYALKLLQSEDHEPLSKDEFIRYFVEYFKSKSSNVDSEVLEEFLNYFIKNSGILIIEKDHYVKFSHKSFLQYYASLEIFKHRRSLEDDLVKNFLDLDWQNVSIFYGGQSKDMPDFLEKIIVRIDKSNTIDQFSNSIMGIGYLLQALYQTDNAIREKAIHTVLEQHLILHDWYKKISSDNVIPFFKKMRLPTISIFNMYFFYLNFLSTTLVNPLGMAFESLIEKYKKTNDSTIGYKLLTLAAILHSNRINDSSYLNRLLDDTKLLSDVYLTTIAEFALYFDNSKYHQDLKKKIDKSFSKTINVSEILRTHPISKLRFSDFDVIQSHKKVIVITEGETDVDILEHAYTVLTDNKIPYWKAKPVGTDSGGANELRLSLDKALPTVIDGEIIIGIFDSDASGINNFKGLKKVFENWGNYKRIKKHRGSNIYGMKLPIPHFRENYVKPEIDMNFIAIEHYFNDELLSDLNMTKETSIPGVFKIKDGSGAKRKFVKHLKTIKDPNIFKEFIPLFETIDDICSVDMDYYKLLD
ncbi:NACHT domain-containing protein [Leeuwenhoekiella sp. A16]|uniref:NACHT domain-containing protein n=1 Tax=unclassified Leeuwenhoekiella TaxID=2615029 RepID=UPI003A7FE23B